MGVAVECDGRTLALFRVDDELYALDDVCSHEYSRLSEGEVWTGRCTAPSTARSFDLRTGEVRGLPATRPVNAYEAKEEDGKIWVHWDR